MHVCTCVCVCVCERESVNMRKFNPIIAHLKASRMRSTLTTHGYRCRGPSEGISTWSDKVQVTI